MEDRRKTQVYILHIQSTSPALPDVNQLLHSLNSHNWLHVLHSSCQFEYDILYCDILGEPWQEDQYGLKTHCSK